MAASVTHQFYNPIADDLNFPGTKPSDWNAEHTVTGVVEGPASAVDGNIAVFDGITGDIIKDSGHSTSELHNPVTVSDTSSIDLTLSGQALSASAIFGTTSGTVCQGNDSRLSASGQSLTPSGNISATTVQSGIYELDTEKAGLALSNTFTQGQKVTPVALSTAATVIIDLSQSNQFSIVLSGSTTIGLPSGIAAGQQGSILLRQNASGNNSVTWGSSGFPFTFVSGAAPPLSSGALACDSAEYSTESYTLMFVTISNATPAVFTTASAHGLVTGQWLQLSTDGALPTGLTAGINYWVVKTGANTFNVATSLANAAAGTVVATSSAGSGTHAFNACQIRVAVNKGWA